MALYHPSATQVPTGVNRRWGCKFRMHKTGLMFIRVVVLLHARCRINQSSTQNINDLHVISWECHIDHFSYGGSNSLMQVSFKKWINFKYISAWLYSYSDILIQFCLPRHKLKLCIYFMQLWRVLVFNAKIQLWHTEVFQLHASVEQFTHVIALIRVSVYTFTLLVERFLAMLEH